MNFFLLILLFLPDLNRIGGSGLDMRSKARVSVPNFVEPLCSDHLVA